MDASGDSSHKDAKGEPAKTDLKNGMFSSLVTEAQSQLLQLERDLSNQQVKKIERGVAHFTDIPEDANAKYSAVYLAQLLAEIVVNNIHASKTENSEILEEKKDDEDVKIPPLVGPDTDTFCKIDAEDSIESVIVTHVVSPNDFYIIKENVLMEMNKLSDFLNSDRTDWTCVGMSDICKGKLYSVQDGVNGKWHRARIVKILPRVLNEPMKGEIYFVDSGNTGLLDLHKIRKLPAYISLQDDFAIHCSLHDVSSPSGTRQWPEEATDIFKDLVYNNALHMCVVKHDANGLYVELLLSDRTGSSSDGVKSLCDTLISMTCADAGQIQSCAANLHYKNCFWQRFQWYEVFVRHVDSPHCIYVQKTEMDTQLERVSKRLQNTYCTAKYEHSGFLLHPVRGMVCAAFSDTDNKWYRAKIVDVLGMNRFRIQYVDYGMKVDVNSTALRVLEKCFIKDAVFVTPCSLADIKPVTQLWSLNSVEFLRNILHTLEVCINVKEILPSGTLNVTMKHSSGIRPSSVLVKCGRAVRVELGSQPVDSVVDTASGIVKRTSQFEVKHVSRDSANFRDVRVTVTHCVGPHMFFVHLWERQRNKRIQKLHSSLQKYCRVHDASKPRNVEMSGLYCVKYLEDQLWYRAVVTSIRETEVEVFLADYGYTVWIPKCDLHVLHPIFAVECEPFHAIRLHISGVVPANGANTWSANSCQLLSEFISEKPFLYIRKKELATTGNILQKSVGVELYSVTETVTGAWASYKTSYQCFSQILVNAEEACRTSVCDSDIVMNQNDGNKHLQTSPDRMNDLKIDEFCLERYASQLSDWLPASPFTEVQFEGKVTYVDYSGHIYIQTATGQHIINQLTANFRELFGKTFPSKEDKNIPVNSACIAQYHCDYNWYRARVIKRNEADNVIDVCFVDYGNLEVVNREDLRKDIYYTQIPIQCVQCTLFGIKPPNNESNWSNDQLTFMHEQIVDHSCVVTVNVPGIVPQVSIRTRVFEDVGNYLVEMGVAAKFAHYHTGTNK